MVSDSLVPDLVLTLITSGASLTAFWVSIAVAVAVTAVIMAAEAIIDTRNFFIDKLLDCRNGRAQTVLSITIVISSDLDVNNAISS